MSNATTATDSTDSDQSDSSDNSQSNSRSVAKRVFASELTSSPVTVKFEDSEDAPTHQLLQTGETAHRAAIAGVLTDVSEINSSMMSARVCDQTGPIQCYAGQYQPDAKTALQDLEPPQHVIVVGKTSTYEPEDGDPLVSLTIESIRELSAEERERWTAETIEQTADRIEALENGESEHASLVKDQYDLDPDILRNHILEAAEAL